MRVLQINKLYYPWIGGIETIVKQIAENLDQTDGFSSTVLACQARGAKSDEIINGVRVIKSQSFGRLLGMPISLSFFKDFKKLAKEPDLILIHHPFPLAFLIVPFLKKPFFIFYHSDIVRQKLSLLPFLPFIRLGLKRARKIFVSGHNLKLNSSLLAKHRDKVVEIPFGVDINRLKPTLVDYAETEKLKRLDHRPLLLAVGRLVYYKGYRYLIEAMTDIEAKLIIIGDGPEKANLQKLINDLGVGDKVNIIRAVTDLKPYYLAADIFVFPSCAPSEAFGIVQLEAMSYGKPVVNTYLKTAVEEVSLNDLTGLTVAPSNSHALAEAINHLLTNKDERERFGRAAASRVREKFTEEIFIGKLKKNLTT